MIEGISTLSWTQLGSSAGLARLLFCGSNQLTWKRLSGLIWPQSSFWQLPAYELSYLAFATRDLSSELAEFFAGLGVLSGSE